MNTTGIAQKLCFELSYRQAGAVREEGKTSTIFIRVWIKDDIPTELKIAYLLARVEVAESASMNG